MRWPSWRTGDESMVWIELLWLADSGDRGHSGRCMAPLLPLMFLSRAQRVLDAQSSQRGDKASHSKLKVLVFLVVIVFVGIERVVGGEEEVTEAHGSRFRTERAAASVGE